jgi:hypothetical protein
LARYALLLLLAWAVWGCAAGEPVDPTPPGLAKVVSLAVSSPRDTVYVGDTLTLAVEARDSAGNLLTGRSVNWRTSDSGLAVVSAVGVVTGVHGGHITISARAGDQISSVALVVRRLVFSVNVVPDAICLRKGFTTSLGLTAFDSLGQPLPVGFRPIAWHTTDGLIVSVIPQPHDSVSVLGASAGTASVIGSILGMADTTGLIVDATPLGEPLVCNGGG